MVRNMRSVTSCIEGKARSELSFAHVIWEIRNTLDCTKHLGLSFIELLTQGPIF